MKSRITEINLLKKTSIGLATIALLAATSRGDLSSTTQPSTQSQSAQAATPTPAPADFSGNLTGDWFGARRKLADAGITVGADLVLEGFDNFQGGLDTAHLEGSTTFDLSFTFDLEKLQALHGGEFYIDLEDHAFRNPTTSLVGDLQVFDKENNSPFLQVFEAWYQQKLFGDKLRVKVGKVDANTEFCVVDNGDPFLGSSSQLSPTIFVMPTTPDPMPSINAFFTPTDSYFASVGAYYANQSDRFGDLVDDPAQFQRTRYGSFLIGETGFQWRTTPMLNFPGNLKLGAWGHTGTFEKFDGNPQQGTQGVYAVFNQTLDQDPNATTNTGPGMRVFFDGGITQSDINPIDHHFGAGFTNTGADMTSPNDVLGFDAQYAHVTHEAGLKYPYELSLEAFKKYQIEPWESITPDIQYIIHPGGNLNDAVVLTVRWEIQF